MNLQDTFELKLREFKDKIIADQRKDSTAGILLFKDHLYRLNKWYKQLDISDKWNNALKTIQGFDILEKIDPVFASNRISLEDFRANYLNDTSIDNRRFRGFEYIFLYYYLYWEIFQQSNNVRNPDYDELPHPYQSVVLIFLRGNHILKGEMGTIEIDSLTVRLEADFCLPSLDLEFLDKIDESSERIGTLGIPNQESVNKIWRDFATTGPIS